MATGWLTDDNDADTYLINKPNSSAWFETGLDKTPYLTEAYRLLLNDPDYSWPSTATTSMQNAQIELAFFILTNQKHLERINLQNAGVSSFRIGDFSENYSGKKGASANPPSLYPVSVLNLISSYKRTRRLGVVRTRQTTDYV